MRRIVRVSLGALLLAACGDDTHDHARLKSGEQLYRHHCARCHQVSGDGAFLRGIPAVKYTQMSYRELIDRILGHHRPAESRMPVFAAMPRAEAEAIAVYIRQRLR